MSEAEQIRVTLEQEADYAFTVRFDGSGVDALLTDEPPPLGGNRGPSPSRLLLASLGNCLATSLLFALRKYDNHPGRIRAEITARLARNADGRWRIPKAFVDIRLPGGNDEYRHLDRVLAQFEQFCIVTESVRQGIDVEVTVRDAHERVVHGDRFFEAGS